MTPGGPPGASGGPSGWVHSPLVGILSPKPGWAGRAAGMGNVPMGQLCLFCAQQAGQGRRRVGVAELGAQPTPPHEHPSLASPPAWVALALQQPSRAVLAPAVAQMGRCPREASASSCSPTAQLSG